MSFDAVLPIWEAVQGRFHKMVKGLSEQELCMKTGSSTIGSMIRHNVEVEYMFAEWFFGRNMPEDIKNSLNKEAAENKEVSYQPEELDALLTASNVHIIEAMHQLSDEAWHEPVESTMGKSTPLEAVGRLIYHTAIHAGQIALIKKNAS
jgi:uncharacterized damage-inducible protein DinB